METFGVPLRAQGAATITASSAREALALATGQPFDLIISDIAMPTMDGFELLARFRKTEAGMFR